MTLWTPSGEHQVPPKSPTRQSPEAPPGQPPEPPPESLGAEGDSDSAEHQEQAEALMAELAAARERLAAAPADVVVANHAMGLYELGAIHLTAETPNTDAARLAIDAMGALVEGLKGRLGESEPTLREALGSLRMAFVQQTSGSADAG